MEHLKLFEDFSKHLKKLIKSIEDSDIEIDKEELEKDIEEITKLHDENEPKSDEEIFKMATKKYLTSFSNFDYN